VLLPLVPEPCLRVVLPELPLPVPLLPVPVPLLPVPVPLLPVPLLPLPTPVPLPDPALCAQAELTKPAPLAKLATSRYRTMRPFIFLLLFV
jgi:hypothetical protein